jgi:hypothetical protein
VSQDRQSLAFSEHERGFTNSIADWAEPIPWPDLPPKYGAKTGQTT